MEKKVDKIIDSLKESALDKPTATLLISADSDKRFFIGEAMLIAAGVALLHSYLSGLLGTGKLGEHHQKVIKEFWAKITSGKVSREEIDASKALAEERLQSVAEESVTEQSKRDAERRIEEILIKEGSTAANAKNLSTAITKAIFRTDGTK